MSSKKQRNRNKAPVINRKYTVAPTRGRKNVTIFVIILCEICGVYMLYAAVYASSDASTTTSSLVTAVVLGILMILIGIGYYPRNIVNKVMVDGNTLTFHRVFHKDETCAMKDVKAIVNTERNKKPASQVPKEYIITYGDDKTFTITRDKMINSEQLYQDLRSRGTVVK
jgi:hypothetical protein